MHALAWFAWLLFTAPPAADQSLLSTALAVAEKVSVPRMVAEENLTWKSGQLAQLARLYAKAGRLEQAQRMVTELDTEERTKVAALGDIVIAALEAGDRARAEALTQQLLASDEWNAPSAVAAIARAYEVAGDHERALGLARQVKDAEARSALLLEIGGSAGLNDALLAAADVEPGRVHVPFGDVWRWLYDYSGRYVFLLDVVRAAVDQGRLDLAREALAAMDKVPEGRSFQWRARALLEIDRGERDAGKADTATWKQALAEVEAGQPEDMGDLTDKVDLMAELAARLGPEESVKLLARAAELSKGAEEIPDSCGRARTLSEMLARLARAHAQLGHKQEALALLDRLAPLAEAMQIPAPVKGSSVDFPSSARQDRVEVLARAAAGFELAGDNDRAAAVLAKAIANIGAIDNEEWRQYAWRAIVEAYAAADKLDRAAAIVGSGKEGDPDKLYAVQELAERLPAADFAQLAPLVSALPAGYSKATFSARLAAHFEKASNPVEATRMMDQALAAIAAKPEAWDQALIALAIDDPQAARPADPERRNLLRAILTGL